MDVHPKPVCYDSVPPCLCEKCQRYDMFMASCVPRTFGQSTSGLAVVNAARSSYANVHSCSVRRKPARSRPRSRAAVSSIPVAVAVSTVVSSSRARPSAAAPSSSVAVSTGSRARPSAAAPSSSVAVSTVMSSSAPFGSRARPSAAALSNSVAVSSPVVSSSSFVSAPSSVAVSHPASSGSLACSVAVSPVRPSPSVVPPVKFGSVPSVSSVPVASSPVWPRFVPRAQSFVPGRSLGSSFVPVVCFVLAFVPVLLFSPFGLVWSFLPVWR